MGRKTKGGQWSNLAPSMLLLPGRKIMILLQGSKITNRSHAVETKGVHWGGQDPGWRKRMGNVKMQKKVGRGKNQDKTTTAEEP